MKPAARTTDSVAHPAPPMLTPGPGSVNTLIGNLPAWRGIPAAMAQALQAAKKVVDATVKAADAAANAAAGTPAAPAAKAAAEATKAAAGAAMGAAMSAMAAGMADIHMCTTPLPVPPHGVGLVIDGSPTVLINNMPACRMGDTVLEALGPPNKITKGEMTVLIGNSGSSGGGGMGAMLGGLAQAAADAAKDAARDVYDTVKDVVTTVDDTAGKALQKGLDVVKDGVKTAEDTVEYARRKAREALEAAAAAAAAEPAVAGQPVTLLPNGDVQIGNNLAISGSLEFKCRTLMNLGQIASTPTGEGLIQSLAGAPKRTTIVETNGGNECGGYTNPAGRMQNPDGTNGAGTNSTVSFNPNRTSIGTEPWETRPPAIGLAHELVHAEQAGQGRMLRGQDNNDARPDPDDPTQTQQTNRRELEAVGVPPYDTYPHNENKIRAEWPPPQPNRPYY